PVVDHPERHSFPTRRSSDLGDRQQHRAARQLLSQQTLGFAPPREPPGEARCFPEDAGGIAERETSAAVSDSKPVARTRRRILSRDRKSTRLNSSHQIISYAV